MSTYMSHHRTGKVPSRNEFVRDRRKPSTMRGDQILTVREAMPCREGDCSICATSTHTQPLCTTEASSPVWGVSCWRCHRRTRERSWGTRTNCLPMVQVVAWLIQWNIYKKIQLCVFVQATYLFFRFQGIRRWLFFQTPVFRVLLFLLLPVNNGKWRI